MLSKIRYILLLLCLSLTTWMSAQQLSDQATISLITCTPGNELYARYGHTAIRVCDPLNQLDVVFNYGIFDFNDEHFYLKFLRGETYYQLGLQYTNDFRLFYGMEKRPIYEQTLNLTPEQRNDIWSALLENYRPENRRYLYNFVFDNCATRPYYLLCRALRTVPEESTYEGLRGKTFRHAIQHYTRQGSWADLGINLIFGPKADCRMTDAERLFLPEELMFYVATITCPNGEKLVQGGEFKVFKIKRVHWYETWYFGMSLLCLLVLAVTLYDRAHYHLSIWFDVLVGVVYGVLLLIVFLLTFFSIHPLVGFGWRLLVIPVVYCSLRSVYWWPKPKHRHHHSHHHHHHHHHSESIEHHSSSSSSHHASSSHHSSHHSSSSSSSSSSTSSSSHHHHHHHHRTTTALVLLLCSVSLVAEQRLTVVAVVDGLCEPNMQQLRQQGNPGGLYTLIQEADHYTFRYSQLVQGGQETTATILTGAQPIDHGYMDDSYYSRSEHRVLPVLYDPQVQAIGCSVPYSPEALMMPTLTDYWRMRYPTAHIYAVGLQPECTVLMAGHSANGCCWIDMSELQWASTSFYKSGLPTAALRQNQKHTVREQASQRWRPYRYDLHDHLLRSPQANQLTTQLALDILEQEHLGTDAVPDMLLIQLTTLAPSSQQDVVHNAEHADMQHSVSKQLSLLMQQLDQRVGHDRYNLLVIGRPVYGAMGSNMRLAGMPERRLTCDQVSTLLGMYLTALYGNERWVEQMHGQSVYLNLQAVQRHGLSLPVVQQTVASFLMEFEGIQVALTQAEAFSHVKMQQSVSKRFVGDVFFVMQPNWRLCLNEDEVYDYNIDMSPSSPVYWWQAGHRAYDRGELTDNQLFNILGLN